MMEIRFHSARTSPNIMLSMDNALSNNSWLCKASNIEDNIIITQAPPTCHSNFVFVIFIVFSSYESCKPAPTGSKHNDTGLEIQLGCIYIAPVHNRRRKGEDTTVLG